MLLSAFKYEQNYKYYFKSSKNTSIKGTTTSFVKKILFFIEQMDITWVLSVLHSNQLTHARERIAFRPAASLIPLHSGGKSSEKFAKKNPSQPRPLRHDRGMVVDQSLYEGRKPNQRPVRYYDQRENRKYAT
jgi:hypothetical protein